MRVNGFLLGFLAAGLLVSTASAQLVINPIAVPPANKIDIGVATACSAIDYSMYDGHSRTVYRGSMGAAISKSVDDASDIWGSLNLLGLSDAKSPEVDADLGYQLSIGGRWHVFQQGLGAVTVYGFGQYLFEKYSTAVGPRKMFVIEAAGGAMGSYAFHPLLTGYLGAELVAYTDGEMRGVPDTDVERDGRVTIRGGAVYELNKYFLRAELSLGSERGILIGASRSF
jgi:hypothetical protein